MFVNFNILNQLGSPAINSNTFANRPAAGQTGRLFVSTDTFEIYRDNGTTWDLIGGPGSSTVTGSGATGQVTYWTGTNTVSGENALFWDAAQNHLGINTATPGVALDVHSAADVALQLNGTGATPSILQQFLSAGVAEYEMGYNWNSDVNYRRFSIYDSSGAKEVLTIDKQSRNVGINYQYTSLADQPAYTFDVDGSFRTTDDLFAGRTTGVLANFSVQSAGRKIATKEGPADYGLIVDFANNEFWLGDSVNGWGYKGDRTSGLIKVGDITGNYGYVITLDYDSANGFIATNLGGNYKGLIIDSQNQTYKLGDHNYDNNGTSLIVDDGNLLIKTINNGFDLGLKLDFTNGNYILGDYNGSNNNTNLIVDDGTRIIKTINQGSPDGLKLDFANAIFGLGDCDNIYGGAKIIIDQNIPSVNIDVQNGDLIYSNINTAGTAGAIQGYIEVNINGTLRKIPYYAI